MDAPFGQTDSSEIFQKVIKEILFGLKRIEISLNDVIVHAKTIHELINLLQKVFKRCREHAKRYSTRFC